jgi:hypothetical protein
MGRKGEHGSLTIEAQEVLSPDISEELNSFTDSAFLRKLLQLRPQNPIPGEHELEPMSLNQESEGTNERRVILARG